MAEPTTSTGLAVAAISTFTLAVFGVDHYAILGGWLGSMIVTGQSQAVGRMKAIGASVLSSIVGAVLGSAGVDAIGVTSRAILIAACMVASFGAQGLIVAVVEAAKARIAKFGGEIK